MSHRVYSSSKNRIIANNITEARRKLVTEIWYNGEYVIDQRGERTKELQGVEVIIRNGDLKAESHIIRQAKDFANGLINDHIALKKGEEFDYSYGERLRRAKQLENTIELLKRDPVTRRAYLPIFQPNDNFSKDELPCWASTQFLVRKNRLNVVDYFRSNECCIAFPSDVYGAMKLMGYIAEKINVKPGNLHHYIASAHLRLSDEDTIKRIVS